MKRPCRPSIDPEDWICAGRPHPSRRPADSPRRARRCDRRRRRTRPAQHRRRAERQLPHLRDERHHQPRPAGRARRPQAVAAPHPRGDERPAPRPQRRPGQVRQDLRRHQRQLPPARRGQRLPHPGPHGPGVEPPLRPHRQAGQLRLHRGAAASRDALHRGSLISGGRGDAHGPRPRDRGHDPQLRRPTPGADRPAEQVPQPAGQRLRRHRRRHGHRHPAAQPARGLRRRRAAHRQPAGQPARPAGGAAGAGLPHRRHHLRPPGHPRRLLHRPRPDHAPRPRRHQRRRLAGADHHPRSALPADAHPPRRGHRRAG